MARPKRKRQEQKPDEVTNPVTDKAKSVVKQTRDDGPERSTKKQKLGAGRPDRARPTQSQYNHDYEQANSQELAESLTEATKKHDPSLTGIELEDKTLPPAAFVDTSAYGRPRLLDSLEDFLETHTDGGSNVLSKCNEKSSPHTILISMSAIRATDLRHAVKKYSNHDNKIAKLFSKHIKLKDAVEFVSTTQFGIGVGTSGRIEELINEDVLKIRNLQRLVLDASYLDSKSLSLFNEKAAFSQLLSLLNHEELKLRLVSGKTRILVF